MGVTATASNNACNTPPPAPPPAAQPTANLEQIPLAALRPASPHASNTSTSTNTNNPKLLRPSHLPVSHRARQRPINRMDARTNPPPWILASVAAMHAAMPVDKRSRMVDAWSAVEDAVAVGYHRRAVQQSPVEPVGAETQLAVAAVGSNGNR